MSYHRLLSWCNASGLNWSTRSRRTASEYAAKAVYPDAVCLERVDPIRDVFVSNVLKHVSNVLKRISASEKVDTARST